MYIYTHKHLFICVCVYYACFICSIRGAGPRVHIHKSVYLLMLRDCTISHDIIMLLYIYIVYLLMLQDYIAHCIFTNVARFVRYCYQEQHLADLPGAAPPRRRLQG